MVFEKYLYGCMGVCVCVACVCMCVHACVRACVRGCVRACVRAYVCLNISASTRSILTGLIFFVFFV